MNRGDAEATRHAAETFVELSQRHNLPNYLPLGRIYASWAGTKLGDAGDAFTEIRQALTAFLKLGNKFAVPSLQGFLAEIEARVEGAQPALTRKA